MQTKYILPLFTLLFVLNSASAFAVDGTPSVKPTLWRQEIREDRRELRNGIQENRQQLKVTLTQTNIDLRRKKVQAIYDEIVKSLNTRLKYYQDMKIKVQTRITDKSSTKNTVDAQTKLNEFDPIVAQYNTHLAAINTKLQEVLVSDKPLTKLGELKTSANTARSDLQKMRKILADAIRLLVKAPAKS